MTDPKLTEANMVDAIVAAYHTTRLADCPVALHILSKPRVKEAIAQVIATALAKESEIRQRLERDLEILWPQVKQADDQWDAKCGRIEELEAALAEKDAVIEGLVAKNYATFTDGMEAAAQVCGSLAETTYDDTDAFEAATGCEAEIMKVVKQQRREQAAPAAAKASGDRS